MWLLLWKPTGTCFKIEKQHKKVYYNFKRQVVHYVYSWVFKSHNTIVLIISLLLTSQINQFSLASSSYVWWIPPSNTGSLLQQDQICHLIHQQCKDTLSHRNHFVWTPGGLSPGEELCTLFHNSCNEKCYHKLISWLDSNCLLFVQITGSFLQWDNIGGHE